jgi:hypothetical protein
MKVQLTHILQNMFQASSLDEVPVNRLEKIVKEHPYFAPAHFLLAKKLQHQGNGEYEQQAQKAALYFHDPLWLHWQLNHGKTEELEVGIVGELEVVEAVEALKPVEEVETVEEVKAVETVKEVEPVEMKTPEPAKPDLPFDPYYTIDYFASQGIKAPQEVQPGDKLGMQLKSFTEWLRTMKRLPQPVAEERSDEAEQQDIQRFAAGSLEEKEVVTETMAEVLVKQDRKEEAIAIYEKLSLLDPSKKAFFAAKIENLKVN